MDTQTNMETHDNDNDSDKMVPMLILDDCTNETINPSKYRQLFNGRHFNISIIQPTFQKMKFYQCLRWRNLFC